MNEMRDDLNDKFDDLRNAMLQCLQSFQPGSISRGGESALGPIISNDTADDTEYPSQQWTFDFDETEARIMKTRFGNEFESAFYNRFFKETETLLKKLPAKKEMEYRNIVTYFSGAITNSELRKVSVRLNDIIRKKNHALMNKISRGSNPAIAMLENSPTVPLIENEDGILIPENDTIAYTRYEDDAIKRYPILLKNGRECDTMFAERRIDNIRRWDYFVISADGLRTDAFYHYY
uniref:Uncharacterized protein n=1 Tax=Panagrolaimus superbus TaxID=310955 RepID=A0A914ZAV3_9BILA